MVKLSRILKDYRRTGALCELIGLFGFVDDRTFLTKSGDLGVVLRVRGVDDECLDPQDLDRVARRFEAAVKIFDERFRIYQHLAKRDRPEIPHRDYDDPVVREAVRSRIEYLRSKADRLYSIEIHLTIVYEGGGGAAGLPDRLRRLLRRPAAVWTETLSAGRRTAILEAELERNLEILSHRVDAFLVQLDDAVGLEPLSKGEAFRFLRRLLNPTPHVADGVSLKYDAFLDYALCDEPLECHRDHLRLGDRFAKVLTLKEPPAETVPHLLRGLLEIPANLILATEFRREDSARMRAEIRRKRRHFHNARHSLLAHLFQSGRDGSPAPGEMLADDAASDLVADLGRCLSEIEIEGRYFGRFSLTVVLFGADRAEIEKSAAECFKVFSTRDGVLVDERYNLLNAFLAVVPGNRDYNLRRLLLLDNNYADLSLLFSPDTGEVRNAHLDAEYLTVLETRGGQPYFLNLHRGDVAHTLVLGATGTGKSFLLNFLVTHLRKYEPHTFVFDLGGGYRHLTRLFSGSYLPMSLERRSFTINPFALPPTAENLQFLFSFVRVLIQSGGHQMDDREERDLYERIENLYEVAPDQRRLFTLSNILGRGLRPHLHRWVQGGPYAAWFDNVEDNLTPARHQCFDFEGMDRYPRVLEPLVFYVLHRAAASIRDPESATTFKVFVMDEAWRFLRDPTIRLYVVEALKTWRKRNAAMILSTQSSVDLDRCEMLQTVVESCPTLIFLANPGMDREAYRRIFHLNETEADAIAALVPKRQILVKRPDLAKVVDLNVEDKGYWLYTSDPYDDRRREEAFERLGFEAGLEELARGGRRQPSPRNSE